MQYGNYVATDHNDIQKAKEAMLEDLIGTIRELAKKDEFWIVKNIDESNPLSHGLLAEGKDTTVGWKITVPQMGEPTPIAVICDGKIIGTLGSK